MANTEEEAKLEYFLQWLQVNGVDLGGCEIKCCGNSKGFGVYASNSSQADEGLLMVVPIQLAITPMRVIQDPLMGPECRAMLAEEEVDDRFIMNLFLIVERLRKNSTWKPYLDMLPKTFGNPLWFTDDELLELKGTTLYRATLIQKKKLQSLYDDKVKCLVKKLLTLDGNSDSEVCFEDFLWANSVFWTRAMNIPFPHSHIFPQIKQDGDKCLSDKRSETCTPHISNEDVKNGNDGKKGFQFTEADTLSKGDTVWIEGIVPGIDFCNHAVKATASWEVGTRPISGAPLSMFLLSAAQSPSQPGKEISISYGNKGNEELLYLYGFVIDDNPDDFLMVHYPVEAIQSSPYSELKTRILNAQKAETRCLLPKSLLDHGFFPGGTSNNEGNEKGETNAVHNFSWSGQRKKPSYLKKLIFPEAFMTSLRTIAMDEEELVQISSLLEEVVGSKRERTPTETEVRAAVWEACGDSGALQLLVDLLNAKMIDLEEESGTAENDAKLLEKERLEQQTSMRETEESRQQKCTMSRNRWSCIVYRKGQKELTRLFLKEAEHALQLSLAEGN